MISSRSHKTLFQQVLGTGDYIFTGTGETFAGKNLAYAGLAEALFEYPGELDMGGGGGGALLGLFARDITCDVQKLYVSNAVATRLLHRLVRLAVAG